MRNEALHPLRNPNRQILKNVMKIKNIKQIAIGLLIGAALHNTSFAGSVAGSHRLEPAIPGLSEKKTVPRIRRPMIATPRQSGSQPAASHQFNAGENSFSVGDDWFRD
jgi:hypothetical protein